MDDHQKSYKLRVFLFLLLAVAIAELWLLIEVGGAIGGFATVLLVLTTAIVGGYQVRKQGFVTWQRLHQRMESGQPFVVEMQDTIALLVAGILLLLPGIMTDVIGFILLISEVRRRIFQFFNGKNTSFDVKPMRQDVRKENTVVIDIDLSDDKPKK